MTRELNTYAKSYVLNHKLTDWSNMRSYGLTFLKFLMSAHNAVKLVI